MKKRYQPNDRRLLEEFHAEASAFVDLAYAALGRPTIRVMAEEAGLSPSTVRKLLHHDFRRPQLLTFQKLAWAARLPLRLPLPPALRKTA